VRAFLSSNQEIKALCARVIQTQDLRAFQFALAELRTAIREHMIEAENKGIHLVLEMSKISEKTSDKIRKDGTGV